MQNPGSPKNQKDLRDEIRDLEKEKEITAKINVWRKYFKKWVKEKNRIFFERFFRSLKKFGLITSYKNFKTYVEKQMFDDFYITDAVKCRAPTSKLKDEHFDTCFEKFLSKEIRYLKPMLIFAFSSRTWNILKRKISMKSMEHAPPIIKRGTKGHKLEPPLVKAHGYLYKHGKDQFIIPLTHMSRKQFEFYLRNSYFDYLEDGLRVYKKYKLDL
jgi:nicotinamidase-related amidase